MRKRIIMSLLLLIPIMSYAQYWGERVTAKSFEQSELYFNSYYLNTFGLNRFRDVSVSLVDDPFLDLYLNPANLPKLSKSNLIYLDFRGDRTEAPIIQRYPGYLYYDLSYIYPPYYIDPRWYNITRKEPEPIFSLGYMTYPFGISSKMFLGATYQLIYKQEKFYSMPTWIYLNRYGYDAFNIRVAEDQNVPIKDRQVGQDEMLNNGHLLSFFLGSHLTSKLKVGFSLNSVIHSRDGIYVNSQSDEYGNTNNYDSYYYNELDRDQNYQHFDLSTGVNYFFNPSLYSGIKIGYLKGEAEQSYQTIYSSEYQYNQINSITDWSKSMSKSTIDQTWNNDGENWYGSINFTKTTHNGNQINFYYRYTISDIDLQNSTEIEDTSYYAGSWTYDEGVHEYLNNYSLSDIRSGSGERKMNRHEIMFNAHLQLTEKSLLSAGCYYSHKKSQISSWEPASVYRYSHYYASGYYDADQTTILIEEKALDWQYQAVEWSLQIPLLLDFRLNSQWSIMLGINRSLYSWNISDETIAYFQIRERTEYDSTKAETNFGERYKEPDKILTEEFTDIISKFTVRVSPDFQIHLLIDPEFQHTFRVAQWWIGFQALL